MGTGFPFKEQYGFDDLVAIMRLLRSEDGCPWDKEQTHESIRKNFIEETYEAVEAIDLGDRELLREELGDVLLQVVFHAEMERQAGGFDIDGVCDGICRKLILRHPHIFGETVASTSDEVLRNWDEIKKQEKAQRTATQSLEAVAKSLPALMRSQKVQQRAAKAGFGWPDVAGALEKAREELDELSRAVETGTPEEKREELGDLLFSSVIGARVVGADAEEALTGACEKFMRRFALCESLAAERGIDMHGASLETLDALWEEAKRRLQS